MTSPNFFTPRAWFIFGQIRSSESIINFEGSQRNLNLATLSLMWARNRDKSPESSFKCTIVSLYFKPYSLLLEKISKQLISHEDRANSTIMFIKNRGILKEANNDDCHFKWRAREQHCHNQGLELEDLYLSTENRN